MGGYIRATIIIKLDNLNDTIKSFKSTEPLKCMLAVIVDKKINQDPSAMSIAIESQKRIIRNE